MVAQGGLQKRLPHYQCAGRLKKILGRSSGSNPKHHYFLSQKLITSGKSNRALERCARVAKLEKHINRKLFKQIDIGFFERKDLKANKETQKPWIHMI